MNNDLSEEIENEWYVVRYSGETPEIAYNSAIYHLGRAENGPKVRLSEEQVEWLKQAAVDRFTEIILRDLQHANCLKSIYRGINRSIVNYRRFCMFCSRQQIEVDQVRDRAAAALVVFLETELQQLQNTNRPSIINCTYPDLHNYALELGVELGDTLEVLEKFCPLSS